MLNMTLGRLFSGGSSILHDLWQWREFTGASDWAWQWSRVPTPLESPRAASLDAAVSLRMPSLLPFAAGSSGTSHNASSYSPTSSGDFRQLHVLIDTLRNSSHRLQCQRRQGQTFMYFDSGKFGLLCNFVRLLEAHYSMKSVTQNPTKQVQMTAFCLMMPSVQSLWLERS